MLLKQTENPWLTKHIRRTQIWIYSLKWWSQGRTKRKNLTVNGICMTFIFNDVIPQVTQVFQSERKVHECDKRPVRHEALQSHPSLMIHTKPNSTKLCRENNNFKLVSELMLCAAYTSIGGNILFEIRMPGWRRASCKKTIHFSKGKCSIAIFVMSLKQLLQKVLAFMVELWCAPIWYSYTSQQEHDKTISTSYQTQTSFKRIRFPENLPWN